MRYFTAYYEREQTRWYGKGASELGLIGEIERETFEHICYGKSPDGSKYLGTKGDPNKRRSATDFTFSAPKSVSLSALVGGDTRLEVAHRTAVEKTLSLIEERYAQTRITTDGNVSTVQTRNLVIAEFDHIESRELDPHLHTHALVMNLTHHDGKWYATNNDRIFQHKKHLGTIYQSYLAAEVEKLGYEIEPRPHGQFEIKGYQREDLVEFSKRRMQILAECSAHSTWQTREDSWDRTRKHKEHLPRTELQVRWQQEAAELGIEIVSAGVAKKAQQPPTPAAKQDYIDRAIAHCSERSVDFAVEDIEKFALAQRLPLEITEIKSLCDERPELIKLDDSYTTLTALVREEQTIAIMRRTQQQLSPIATTDTVNQHLNDSTLNAGQRQAVRLATTTRDRVVAWQGVAGAGKTFALASLKQIADREGITVSGFAPSAEAAKVLGEELGFEAQTVARKICSSQEPPSGERLWVVDEAGLLSADDARSLLSRAEAENARVLLVGDTRQLSSVAAGNPFKSLQAAGMATARLSVSLRQKHPNLKAAVDALADGAIDRGFSLLEQNGSIVTVASDEIAQEIAAEYLALTPAQRERTLIVSGTNQRRSEITAAIRSGLRAAGSIGVDIDARQLVDYKYTRVENGYAHNYQVGDIVVPLRNYQQLVKGQSYEVTGKSTDSLVLKSPDGGQITTDLNFDKSHYHISALGVAVGDRMRWTKNDKQLQRRNGQEFEIVSVTGDLANIKYDDGRQETIDLREAHHFDLAMAKTIYSSQGKTSERVLVAADGVQNSESFYVAASRAKTELKIYTDSPENLLSMAMESMSNTNPRELISKLYRRQAVLRDRVRHDVGDGEMGGIGVSSSRLFSQSPSPPVTKSPTPVKPQVITRRTDPRLLDTLAQGRKLLGADYRVGEYRIREIEPGLIDKARYQIYRQDKLATTIKVIDGRTGDPEYGFSNIVDRSVDIERELTTAIREEIERMYPVVERTERLIIPEPCRERETDPNLLTDIEQIRYELGYPQQLELGNYAIRLVKSETDRCQYRVEYNNMPVISIHMRDSFERGVSRLIDTFSGNSIERYERGLSSAIVRKIEELREQRRQSQKQQEEALKPRLVAVKGIDLRNWKTNALNLKRSENHIERIDQIINHFGGLRYTSDNIADFNISESDFIKLQQDLSDYRALEQERKQAQKPYTGQYYPTAGELRKAYGRFQALGNTPAMERIAELGAALNAVYPDSDRAPGNFNSPQVEVSFEEHQTLIKPPPLKKAPAQKLEQKPERKRSRGLGMSM